VVNRWLRGDEPEFAARHQYATTLLLLGITDDGPPQLLGFVALALSQIRLTNSEKRPLDTPRLGFFGAIRVALVGVDAQHQGQGHGQRLLESAAGLARRVNDLVAVRFLVLDANPERHDWYRSLGWQDNESEAERTRLKSSGAISMRFDLHG
jgi:GNAT superfamily N-acetyltransferase